MTAHDWRDYIVLDERILAGKPGVKGTRLSVEFALELLAGIARRSPTAIRS